MSKYYCPCCGGTHEENDCPDSLSIARQRAKTEVFNHPSFDPDNVAWCQQALKKLDEILGVEGGKETR